MRIENPRGIWRMSNGMWIWVFVVWEMESGTRVFVIRRPGIGEPPMIVMR